MVNAPDRIYVERFGRIMSVEAAFIDEEHLRRIIDKMVARVGRRLDEGSPMVDARLPDGSRINAVLPPIAIDGAVLTIRKFAADPYTMEDLISFGTLTKPVADLLAACVRGRLDMLITGGTGTGKTTATVLALVWPRSEAYDRMKQIVHFGPGRAVAVPKQEAQAPASNGGRIARTALAATATVVRSGGMEDRLSLRLERAGMKLRPHEWVLVRTLITVGSSVLRTLARGIWAGLVGLISAWLGTWAYQCLRISRRSRQFAEQLPDGLQLVIGSLRSGFSLISALESLVRESPEPLAAEFGRAVAEHRLGADLSDALDRLAARARSEDLSWAVMAVRIQRDVGGNLAPSSACRSRTCCGSRPRRCGSGAGSGLRNSRRRCR